MADHSIVGPSRTASQEELNKYSVQPASPTFNFVYIYDEYFSFVWRTLRRLGVSEGALDDLAQEVFLVVHRRLSGFRGDSSIKTWIFSIILRVVRTHWRTKARRPAESLDNHEPICPDPTPADNLARTEAKFTLRALLQTLDEEKRVVFVMVELEEMSCPEVATVLGVNLNTIYSRLRAARHLFEAELSRYQAQEQEEQ